ncbi:cell envelope biogenesis protein TolA [Enterobacter kobei]|nr:cell envelope biogenesis protein TolA [Enterobacter kobei]
MLLTETEVAKQIRDGVLPSPYKFTNMWLVNLRITGTGLAYRSNEKEHVWRSPDIYLNPQFLERCSGVPVIIDHPEGKIIDQVGEQKRIVGTVMLPYIRGDEVWGISRIYGDEIAEYMIENKEAISTSPSVVFCGGSGCVDVNNALGDDQNFLLEGTPYLIDHVALVPLGVWDKGDNASGIEVTAKSEKQGMKEAITQIISEAFGPVQEQLRELNSRLVEMEKERG